MRRVSILVLTFLFHLCRGENRDLAQDIWGDDSEDAACVCVSYYLCQNTDGEGLIDIRIKECPDSYLDVCCPKDKIIPEPTPPPPKKCGFRNSNGVGLNIRNRINHEAQFGEFPWTVAVLAHDKTQAYQCGGALIHPQVVVTAAHCVTQAKNLKIRAGEWDTQTNKEQYLFQERDVESFTTHSQFVPFPLYNDIALLFLDRPVELTPHVNVVCLPPPNMTFDGQKCVSSGWAKKDFGKAAREQAIMKKFDLPIVPQRKCQLDLKKSCLWVEFKLHRSFICAGGEEGKDTCRGDSGNPLVCPVEGEEGRYFQVGISAWGIDCGNWNVPGFFVNIAMFREWIDGEMESKHMDTSVYQV